MQVLVVDDEPAIREVLRESLRMHGHQVATCESADVAVQLLPYVDAVICDGLDFAGFKVVVWANRFEKPVVLYTGSDEIATAAAAGSIPCVRKPGSIGDLLAALTPQAVDEEEEPEIEDGIGGHCGNCEAPLPSFQSDGSLCPRCEAEHVRIPA